MVGGRAIDPTTDAVTDEATLRRTRRMVAELLDVAVRLRRPAPVAQGAGPASGR